MTGETIERSLRVPSTVEDVWAVIGDVERMPEWSEDLERVELLDGDGRSVGSTFRGHNRAGERTWSMTCVIDRYEPGSLLEFHTRNDKGETRTRWWYRVEPDGDAAVVTEGFERIAKLSRLRALAERKVLGDRTEYNARNIDASLRRLTDLLAD